MTKKELQSLVREGLIEYFTEDHISFSKEEMQKLHADGEVEKNGHTIKYNESVNEAKKVTQEMWDKDWRITKTYGKEYNEHFAKRMEAAMSVARNEDQAEKWALINYKQLPKGALKMVVKESVNEAKKKIKPGTEIHWPTNHKNKSLAGRSGYVEKIKGNNALMNMHDNSNNKAMWIPVPIKDLPEAKESINGDFPKQYAKAFAKATGNESVNEAGTKAELEKLENELYNMIKSKTRDSQLVRKHIEYRRKGGKRNLGDIAKGITESVNEAKKMTFSDYLKILDKKFADAMNAVTGQNGDDAQIKPTRGDILQNFTLFRNYISSLLKKYGSDKTKLKFLSERIEKLYKLEARYKESVNEAKKVDAKAMLKMMKDPSDWGEMAKQTYIKGGNLVHIDSFWAGSDKALKSLVDSWKPGGHNYDYWKKEYGVGVKVVDQFIEMRAEGRHKKFTKDGVVGVELKITPGTIKESVNKRMDNYPEWLEDAERKYYFIKVKRLETGKEYNANIITINKTGYILGLYDDELKRGWNIRFNNKSRSLGSKQFGSKDKYEVLGIIKESINELELTSKRQIKGIADYKKKLESNKGIWNIKKKIRDNSSGSWIEFKPGKYKEIPWKNNWVIIKGPGITTDPKLDGLNKGGKKIAKVEMLYLDWIILLQIGGLLVKESVNEALYNVGLPKEIEYEKAIGDVIKKLKGIDTYGKMTARGGRPPVTSSSNDILIKQYGTIDNTSKLKSILSKVDSNLDVSKIRNNFKAGPNARSVHDQEHDIWRYNIPKKIDWHQAKKAGILKTKPVKKMSHDVVIELLDMMAPYTSKQHELADQVWTSLDSFMQHASDYIKGGNWKRFQKAVKEKYPVLESIKEDITRLDTEKLSDEVLNRMRAAIKKMGRKLTKADIDFITDIRDEIKKRNLKEYVNESTEFAKHPNSKSGDIFFSKRDGGFAVRDGDELKGLSTFEGKAKLRKVQKTDKRYEHLGKLSEKDMLKVFRSLYSGGGHTEESTAASVKAMHKLASSIKESINEAKPSYPSFESKKNIKYYDGMITKGYWTYSGREVGGKGLYKNVHNGQMMGVNQNDLDYFKKHLRDIEIIESVNEANKGKVHKAAKKGSYPAVIVVIEKGKVIHQEPVSTPEIAPAIFNVLQKKYPNTLIHLEDNTGKRLYSESVNEAKKYKKGDKLKIKLKNGKEFDLTFDAYTSQKGVAFGKFDGDRKPFSLDTVIESVNEAASERMLKGIGLELARKGKRKDVSHDTLMALLNIMPIARMIKDDEKERVVKYAMEKLGIKESVNEVKNSLVELIREEAYNILETEDPFVPKYGTGDVVHDCPKHVEIEEHGLKGKVVGHTLNEAGEVNYIDIDFGTGKIYENIPTSKVKILQKEFHKHEVKEELIKKPFTKV